MDREYISQHNVVERYLSGRLTEEELAAFEERCLWDPETLDELEVAEKLREGLREVGAERSATATRGPVARWLLSPQWAAAASVMLVVSLGTTGGLLLSQSRSPDDTALATARVYSIEMMRGGGSPSTVVRVSPADRWVVLLVYPDMSRHERFRASLLRAGEHDPVWEASDIPAGTAESLAVSVQAALLAPGDYRLQVAGLAEGLPAAQVGEVSFRVAPGE